MKSADTGLLKSWPERGPTELWNREGLGKGFSPVTIANKTIYVTGTVGDKEQLTALDMDGNIRWTRAYGKAWDGTYPGARTTPTVTDGHLFLVSGQAEVVCLDAQSGERAWYVDTIAEYGARNLRWGISESPLVANGHVVCTAGGEEAGMVALSQSNGRLVWRCEGLSEKAGYCSPILVEHGKHKMIVTMTERHAVGVDLITGELLWTYRHRNKWAAHPNTPICQGDKVFITSGYDVGATLLELAPNGRGIRVVWEDKTMDTHHGNVVLVDGYLYGSSWNGNSQGNWVCQEFETGKVMYDTEWKPRGARPVKGSLTYADGMLYCYEEKSGYVGLVPATPTRFHAVSTFRIQKGAGPHWAHPVVTGGRLYIRHGDVLMAFDVKAP